VPPSGSFNGMPQREWADQMVSGGGWLAGLGPLNLREWHVIHALWLDCTTVPTTRGSRYVCNVAGADFTLFYGRIGSLSDS
jgi:hypothetical protein